MAGGAFDVSVGKIRPGTYVNFEAPKTNTVEKTERGVVVIPIAGSKYGKKGSVIEVSASNADTLQSQLGFSVYDNEESMLLIREALKKATTVKVYLMNEGEKATITSGSLTATALYGGSRGNSFTVTIVANAINGYDVTIYLAGSKVEEFTQLSTVEELIACNSKYLTFSGTGDLTEVAGAVLTGGTDGETANSNLTTFLDDLENISFNAVAFPIDDLDVSAFASIKSKIKYLRNSLGKTGQFVVANYAGDYEGIINVTNGVILSDETVIDAVKATAYVAGATAGAAYNTSNTYSTYDDAVKVFGIKENEKAELAIKNGEFFFSLSNDGKVIIEYDINSLATAASIGNRPDGYKKNRFIRVIDTLLEDLQTEFPPARFNNNREGWDLMEGRGNAILKQYESDNAISDVDYENDFLVDRTKSSGDATYINVAIKPVDSAEKIYITVKTE